jgi:hypothetical protein
MLRASYKASLKQWFRGLKENMSTARAAFWNNYKIMVKPAEHTRRLFRWYGNYWFYGTGQTIALLLNIKALKKLVEKDTIICNWFIRKLDEKYLAGSGNFTKAIIPNQKIADIKLETEVIEYSGKYAVELEIKGIDDIEFQKNRAFVISVIDRVDFQIQTLSGIGVITAVALAVISLIISIVAICNRVS